VEEILKKNLGDKYQFKRYKDAVHGFTVRGDDMIEKEKKQKEEAAEDGIKFVKKWFN
jgi:dienelactone hydrolase